MAGKAAIKLVVRGQVQGVGFRMAMKEYADKIDLTGWVRNVPSGEVEAEIHGEKSHIIELLEWLQHESGFIITSLETMELIAEGNPKTFVIKT